jgi:SAM-dependent methyltransferase
MEILVNLVHFIFRLGQFKNKYIKILARNTHNKKILELGSGKSYKSKYIYSVKNLFDSSNEFIQSDIIPEFGHKLVDVTKMNYKNEFDVILCLNLLEHIYDFKKAISNMYEALKEGGIVSVLVPCFYPLHDEPYDYWRFTSYSLKKMFSMFKDIKIVSYGIRKYPFGYYLEARK